MLRRCFKALRPSKLLQILDRVNLGITQTQDTSNTNQKKALGHTFHKMFDII